MVGLVLIETSPIHQLFSIHVSRSTIPSSIEPSSSSPDLPRMSPVSTVMAICALIRNLHRPLIQNRLLTIIIALDRLALTRFCRQVPRPKRNILLAVPVIDRVHQRVKVSFRPALQAAPGPRPAAGARLTAGWAAGVLADDARRYVAEEAAEGWEAAADYEEVGFDHSVLTC